MSWRETSGGGPLSQKLLVAALATLFALTLIEGGSYLFGVFEGPLQPLTTGSIQIYGRHDHLLFWSLRPHAKAPDGTPWINRDGLRGPELRSKEPGEFRILSLGESTTFAPQMPYEQSYSAVLERYLNAEPRETRVRVMNAGVPGYTLFQGVHFLLHRAMPFEPDLVLLYFGYNDFLPVAFLADRAGDEDSKEGGFNDWELFELRQTTRGRLAGFMMDHSNFYRGVLQLMVRKRAEEPRRDVHRKRRVPLRHRERLLALARDFSREEAIELVIVIPIYREFGDHIALLRSFSEANGIPTVDLPAMLTKRFGKLRHAFFLDPLHPTPAAHRVIAESIFQVISPLVP